MAEPSHPMLCGACVGIIYLNENEINDARSNFRYHCFGCSKLFQKTIVRSTMGDKIFILWEMTSLCYRLGAFDEA